MWLAVGGAIGTCARYALALANASLIGMSGWPWSTFAVNALGSFGLGVVFFWLDGRYFFGADARVVFGAGLMGGFTTYSTFNLETLEMVDEGQWVRAIIYIVATLVLCLGAGLLGLWLGKQLRG